MSKTRLPDESEWPGLPRSKADAEAVNLKWYWTGKPCANGHVWPRNVSKGECAACIREHAKRHNAKNAERLRPEREARKAQHKAEREAQREARRSDPVLIAEREVRKEQRKAAASAAHRKLIRDLGKEEGTDKIYADRAELERIRYANNGEKQRERARDRYRRGEKGHGVWLKRVPPWVTEDERQKMRAFYKNRPGGMVVDHIVPLGHPLLAGLHVLANLQYLQSARENIKKGNRIVYSHTEALELIRLGLAVWRTDVGDDDGVIDWSAYSAPLA